MRSERTDILCPRTIHVPEPGGSHSHVQGAGAEGAHGTGCAPFPLPDRLRAAVAVHHRHFKVEEHDVVHVTLHLCQRLPAVRRDVHLKPLRLERALEEAADGVAVVDDKHSPPFRRRW